jgi:hypothetical protein
LANQGKRLVAKIVCGVTGYARIYPDILLVLFDQDALQ